MQGVLQLAIGLNCLILTIEVGYKIELRYVNSYRPQATDTQFRSGCSLDA
jgi:hypothetical protein